MHFRSTSFKYIKKTKTFTANMSVLSLDGAREILHRVYDDACDDGLVLISDVTGKSVTYVVVDTMTSRLASFSGWVLEPTQESVRKVPSCKGTQVIIFNN